MFPSMLQLALRLPHHILEAADNVADQQRAREEAAGRAWAAAKINRSSVLRSALEKGLMILGSELGQDKKSRTARPKPRNP